MSLEKWILVIAAVLAIGTGVFVFQHEEQNPAIVEQYEEELNDNIEVIDLLVSTEYTKEEVIKKVNEAYPEYEIIEISSSKEYWLIRIKGDKKW